MYSSVIILIRLIETKTIMSISLMLFIFSLLHGLGTVVSNFDILAIDKIFIFLNKSSLLLLPHILRYHNNEIMIYLTVRISRFSQFNLI